MTALSELKPIIPTKIKMTARDVIKGVRQRYGTEGNGLAPEWSILDEFTLGTGVGRPRADLFLMRAWSGMPKGHERILIEVKISRADLAHELARPEKIANFAAYAHRVYFATPPGLVNAIDVLGPGVGLIEVHTTSSREVRRAKRNPMPDAMPEGALVEAFRRASRSEARHRDANKGDSASRIVELERRLASSMQSELTARNAASRDAQRLQRWLQTMVKAGGAICTCGSELSVPRDFYGSGLKHKDKTICPNRYGYPEIDLDNFADKFGL